MIAALQITLLIGIFISLMISLFNFAVTKPTDPLPISHVITWTISFISMIVLVAGLVL